MTRPQKNSALVGAIVLAVVSLPLTWMSIQNAQLQGEFGALFGKAFRGISLDVTGLNGNITFLVETPIWFIICVVILASVLQLMNGSKTFAIPILAEWITAALAIGWTGLAVILGSISDEATLGMGAILGFFSAVIPCACLLLQTSANPSGDSS